MCSVVTPTVDSPAILRQRAALMSEPKVFHYMSSSVTNPLSVSGSWHGPDDVMKFVLTRCNDLQIRTRVSKPAVPRTPFLRDDMWQSQALTLASQKDQLQKDVDRSKQEHQEVSAFAPALTRRREHTGSAKPISDMSYGLCHVSSVKCQVPGFSPRP